jgi:hypothetical protein
MSHQTRMSTRGQGAGPALCPARCEARRTRDSSWPARARRPRRTHRRMHCSHLDSQRRAGRVGGGPVHVQHAAPSLNGVCKTSSSSVLYLDRSRMYACDDSSSFPCAGGQHRPAARVCTGTHPELGSEPLHKPPRVVETLLQHLHLVLQALSGYRTASNASAPRSRPGVSPCHRSSCTSA